MDARGDYIVIENTSIGKPVVLTNWTLRRRGVDVPLNNYVFKHFVLHPTRQIKVYARGKGRDNLPHEVVSDTVTTWGVGTYALTSLVNHLNQEKATLLEKVENYEREPPASHLRTSGRLNSKCAAAAAAALAAAARNATTEEDIDDGYRDQEWRRSGGGDEDQVVEFRFERSVKY